MDLSTLPKIELHLHLDCSLSFDVASRLDPSLDEEEYRARFIAPRKCSDLADLISRSESPVRLMQSEDALRLVVRDLFEQLERDNVLYAEMRFAPLLHTDHGLAPDRIVDVVDRAVSDASAESGIEARVILCTLRHYSREDSLRTARLVDEHRGGSVVALDIAGDEAGFPLDPHVDAFRLAIDRGLHRTAHAGEARGPESVWETLSRLQPSRIGHGVRSEEDPVLVEHLRDAGVHLEVCPTSNVQSDIFETLADHNIARLHAAGVSVGVNTDGRTLCGVNLTEEYRNVASAFGWEPREFLECNLEAARAAFLSEEERGCLERTLVMAHERAVGAPSDVPEARAGG